MECVVLAGGKGTRLRSVVSDLPKCMAPVAGRPFLAWLLDDLREAGFDHIILSLGYKHEAAEAWVATRPDRDSITYVVEEEPLGTGGGVPSHHPRFTVDPAALLPAAKYFAVLARKRAETKE